jgi:uncharacterized protein YceK
VNVNRITALALVIAILLAGCTSVGPLSDTQSPTEATQPATTPSTTTTDTTPTPTPYVATPPPTATSVPTETWTKPETPKSPEEKGQDRISNVKFVNKVEASNGNSYTNFDLQVSANTLFQNIDPTPSEDGEPYIYVEINGKAIVREELNLRKDGSFTIKIPPGALEQFDSGTLEVSVTLYDDDHKHDDRYGTWTGTIEYTATDDNSNTNARG